MKISCNNLKKHIKNSDTIDWLKIWDTFTIRSAEVEGVEEKGKDIEGVIVGEILTCEKHPDSNKLHILSVNIGEENLQIVCGAPNVRVGLKVALIQVGGRLGDIKISKRPLLGVDSYGMCCSGVELGISDDHSGIIELPSEFEIGTDIKELLPIDDIIVEIDNKSLTNRPDLWGHYGIAREIAAITGNDLMPLEVAEIPSGKKDLKIKINNSDLCYRYTGLTIDNITEKKSPLNMQIFLFYTGMRSISLLVDLTNYIMLELGQPMHAFDATKVGAIEVGLAKDGDTFRTLDGIDRNLTKENLMIKNGDEYFAIAGVMGGLDSEILETTTSIFLESANFDATSIRKTATALGLRTEASSRYEKSLDPNMTKTGIKRFVKLLLEADSSISYTSNITDIYPTKIEEKIIDLTKANLTIYMGFEMSDEEVVKILESLKFKVTVLKDKYSVTVPTFRATKDISIEEDLIEEISRIYGYENLKVEPLKLDLTFTNYENTIESEYEVKKLLATKYNLNEVHTYLWYKTEFLKSLGIEKQNTSLSGKVEDNILRDDLPLSLLETSKENLKNMNSLGIFEIGTVIHSDENSRVLSVLLADNDKNINQIYNQLKDMACKIFKIFKNKKIVFQKSKSLDYYNDNLSYDIIVDKKSYGMIKVFNSKIAKNIARKKAIAILEINFDLFMQLTKEINTFKEISKYPETTLEYTIVMPQDYKYIQLKTILDEFKSSIIINCELIDVYYDEEYTKYSIRYTVGSFDKTLESKELEDFKNKFITHLEKNNLSL